LRWHLSWRLLGVSGLDPFKMLAQRRDHRRNGCGIVEGDVEVRDHAVGIVDHDVEMRDHAGDIVDHGVEMRDHALGIVDHGVEVRDHALPIETSGVEVQAERKRGRADGKGGAPGAPPWE
jgi:hypothetical protein